MNQLGFMDRPYSFAGLPVYEVQPKFVPVLQLSEDFKWVTDEFRAKQNAYLLDKFGTRDESIIPLDSVFMTSYGIMARPEHTAILGNILA